MEYIDSLILNNSNITLKSISEELYCLSENKSIGNLVLIPNGITAKKYSGNINFDLAHGDFRDSVIIVKNGFKYYLFCGANSGGAYPINIAIGKKGNSFLYLINEVYSNVGLYSEHPNCIKRSLLIIGPQRVYEHRSIEGHDISSIDNLSQNKLIALRKAKEGIEIFGEYLKLNKEQYTKTK